jgi:hypothetical protein
VVKPLVLGVPRNNGEEVVKVIPLEISQSQSVLFEDAEAGNDPELY